MEEEKQELEEPKIKSLYPKRSSLKPSNSLAFQGLSNINVKKRNSVSFKINSNINFDKIKTTFDNIENENENIEKKNKFNEIRRQSLKNEFSLVKDLLKRKFSIEEIEEDEDEEIKDNTKKNLEQGKKYLNYIIENNIQ
jgi:hypothetical protein